MKKSQGCAKGSADMDRRAEAQWQAGERHGGAAGTESEEFCKMTKSELVSFCCIFLSSVESYHDLSGYGWVEECEVRSKLVTEWQHIRTSLQAEQAASDCLRTLALLAADSLIAVAQTGAGSADRCLGLLAETEVVPDAASQVPAVMTAGLITETRKRSKQERHRKSIQITAEDIIF